MSNLKSYMKIDSDSYSLWKVQVRSKLVTKGFPKEVLNQNSADKIYDLHSTDKGITVDVATAYLFTTLDDTQMKKIQHYTTSYQVIQVLDAEYDSHSTTRLVTLICSLFSLRMTDSSDVHAHMLLFEDQMNQIDKQGLKFEEKFKVVFFLITLPDFWSTFVTTFEVSRQGGDLKWVPLRDAIIGEYQRHQLAVSSSAEGGERVFATRSTLYCTHCKGSSHLVDQCFTKYPHLKLKFDKKKRRGGEERGNKKA